LHGIRAKTQGNSRIEVMRRLCESYLGYKDKIANLNARIADYEKMRSETDPKDWHVIDEYENRDKAERIALLKKTMFFDSALDRLDSRTAFVFRQLYVERALWDTVEDQHGKRLSPSSIALEREKGFKLMAEFYDWSELE